MRIYEETADMFKITSRGIPELQKRLKELAPRMKLTVVRAFMEHLIGDSSHGLKHEPYYKYVNRQAGFPGLSYMTSTGKVVPGFASEKQHRYVMAAIARGEINPGQDNRTHRLVEGWKMPEISQYNWTMAKIVNDVNYAPYVYGGTRMHALIGWRAIADIIATNFRGAIRAAQQAVNRALKK